MNWQPIDTAPLSDSWILTDEGPALWLTPGEAGRYGYREGWFQADPLCSYLLTDSDEGIRKINPKWWIKLPPTP